MSATSPRPEDGDRSRRFSDFLRRIVERLKGQHVKAEHTSFLPYTSYEESSRRAEERRANLRAALADIGDAGYLRREFLEVPPEAGGVERRFLDDTPTEAFGQMARLRWQLGSEELLLIERLVDAIVVFKRQDAALKQEQTKTASAEDYPLVKLEPLDEKAEANGLFPWKAVIETSDPEYFRKRLAPLQGWLGIGVDLAPRREINLTGRCTVGGGLEGVVGGMVEDHEPFLVTCAHVLSSECGSRVIVGNPYASVPDGIKNEPDAALIEASTPCFTELKGSRKRKFSCADEQIALRSVNSRAKVFKFSPRKKGPAGLIYNQVAMFPASNSGPAYRFPHLEIRPDRTSYLFGILKYPISKYFSREGDSGSWVVEESLGIWFGIVIGRSDYGSSYVAEGRPLLDFFELQLKAHRGASAVAKLTPYTIF